MLQPIHKATEASKLCPWQRQIKEDRVDITTRLQCNDEKYEILASRFELGQDKGQQCVNKPQESRETTKASRNLQPSIKQNVSHKHS